MALNAHRIAGPLRWESPGRWRISMKNSNAAFRNFQRTIQAWDMFLVRVSWAVVVLLTLQDYTKGEGRF